MFVLIILCLINTITYTQQIKLDTYTKGSIILEPINYEYKTHFIIEMWGGGSDGNNNDCGSSGGYLKILVPSLETTWIINIGTNNQNTTFASIYNEYFFVASCCGENNYIYNKYNDIEIYYDINGSSQIKYDVNSEIFCNGGITQFSGLSGMMPGGGGNINKTGGYGMMNIYY